MSEINPNGVVNPFILMVDDDEEDVYLTKRAFCGYLPSLVFNSVPDGSQLFDFLEDRVSFENVPSDQAPSIILLDINIPRENGFEILSRLKSHPKHRHLPVIMLTTSCSDADVRRAYGLGASSYASKTVNAADMKKVAAKVCDFWFDFALVPLPRGNA